MLGGTTGVDLRKRSWPRPAGREIAASAALTALALATLSPLLLRPDRFPAAGHPQIAGSAIADALNRERWERTSGEISYLDPDLGGRNRALDRASFYTHPLYFAFSRVLPAGLSLTLVALLHLLLLGLGTHAVSRRLGYAHGPSLFSGTVAVLAGAAAGDLVSPGGMSAAACAAL